MKTENGVIILEDATGFTPNGNGTTYTDLSGMKIFIPLELLVRLYEGTKFDFERHGYDWEKKCDMLFKKGKEINA